MTRFNWRDAEHRRDALIVVSLFALGIAVNVAIGLMVIWLLQALGLWDVALAVELDTVHPDQHIVRR